MGTDKQPTKEHWLKRLLWGLSHLYFPIIVHFMTDKYEKKHHHLVIDLVYGVITFMLVAANIGVGIWFYLYFTPAELDVTIVTRNVVVSGEATHIDVQYANPNRAIEDVEIDVLLPDGVAFGTSDDDSQLTYAVGDVGRGVIDSIPIEGTVFGSVGQRYTFQFVTSYTYLGRRQTEVTPYVLEVVDSSFVISIEMPSVAVYDRQIEAQVQYNNRSDIPRSAVSVSLDLPSHFVIDLIHEGDLQLYFDAATGQVGLGGVDARSSGSFSIVGHFVRPEGTVTGDQESVVSVTALTVIDPEHTTNESPVELSHNTAIAPVEIVQPRVTTAMTMPSAVDAGGSIRSTILVNNVGDRAVERIELSVGVIGDAAFVSGSSASHAVNGSLVSSSDITSEGRLAIPTIDRIEAGESVEVSVRIPTAVIAGQEIRASAHVKGAAYSPELETVIPVGESSGETKFNSRLSVSVKGLYTGPAGEELGYGPYPPRSWEPTAFRLIMSVSNPNNPVSGVVVRTTLPGQVSWNNLYSVSAGTQVSFNEETREVRWTIPSLSPQEQAYGAQFEIVLTPNHMQIGLQPLLSGDISVSAIDSFTNSILNQTVPGVRLPVAIIE